MNHSGHQHDNAGDIRILKVALALTILFLIVETISGFLTNSLSLLSDAGHMLSDIITLVISLYAAFLANRAPTARKSYGYSRTEVLAALVNGMLLWVMIGIIALEAIQRLFDPRPVKAGGVIIVGVLGLLVNVIVAWMLHDRDNMNMRGAYYHVVADALGSVAAVVSGILIYITGWYSFDPILSFAIGALVLFSSWSLIRDSINILMESAPKHLDPGAIRQSVLLLKGVDNIHDLHIWSIGSKDHALSAHIVVPNLFDPSEVRCRIEELLRNQFHLNHTTLQIEVLHGCTESHE